MTRPVGWALLGPGRHATRNVVPQMRKAAGTRPVAVVSRDRARGEAYAAEHGFARAYLSLDQALRDPDIDALYDATPDGLHAGNAIAAARAGKHMLVEKPLAISVGDCARAMEACRRHGVKLGAVFQQRHEAVHQETRRMVAAGEIGDVVLARVHLALARPAQAAQPHPAYNWRADPAMRPGGIVMGIGDHAYDTLAWLVGQDIEEVSACTDATQSDPPNERVASLSLRLSGGAIGHAAASSKTPYGQRPIEIHGTRGSLVLANTYTYLTGAGPDAIPTLEASSEHGRSIRTFPPTETFRLEIEQFNRAIAGDDEPMTTPLEGLRAQAVAAAIYASMRSGRAQKVADFLTG